MFIDNCYCGATFTANTKQAIASAIMEHKRTIHGVNPTVDNSAESEHDDRGVVEGSSFTIKI